MRNNLFKLLILTPLWLVTPGNVCAGEIAGFIAVDTRAFLHGPQFGGQKDGLNGSVVFEPEYYHVSDDESDTFTFRPFARIDNHDQDRTHLDIRQLDWLHVEDDWQILVGASKVFWGVTESNHLVDIINQDDAVEDIDGEDKFGQPMAQLAFIKDWGTVRAFYLPYFRERSFASANGRLRGGTVIDTDQTIYEHGAQEWHPDFALRYEHVLGDWDIGVAHFSGTSREPQLVSGINGSGDSIFKPKYGLIDQSSVDLQYTTDAWLWKFEGMTRSGQGDRIYAAAGGFEYTFFNLMDEGADLGLLLEYSADERDAEAPGNSLDNDVFVATRLIMNDAEDTEFLAGITVDASSYARGYRMEASRRFSDNVKIEFDLQLYGGINTGDPEAGFAQDDHAQLRIAYYF